MTTNSREVVGNRIPDLYGSLTNDFRYKGFDLSILTTYSIGGEMLDGVYGSMMNVGYKGYVWHKNALRRWQKPGDITNMKDIRDRNVTTGASSRFVQKNNTLQWSSLTMSYNFRPEQLKKLHLSGLRLSFTMNDLFYWSTIRQERGLDYPYSRSFNLTTNIIF